MPSKERAPANDRATARQRPRQPETEDLQELVQQADLASLVQRATPDPRALTVGQMLQLQRIIGNQAVVQLARWTSLGNRNRHYDHHSSDRGFAYSSAEDYGRAASNFVDRPPPGTQSKTRSDGSKVTYDAASDRLAIVTSGGQIITFFQPGRGDSQYGQQYFDRQ